MLIGYPRASAVGQNPDLGVQTRIMIYDVAPVSVGHGLSVMVHLTMGTVLIGSTRPPTAAGQPVPERLMTNILRAVGKT